MPRISIDGVSVRYRLAGPTAHARPTLEDSERRAGGDETAPPLLLLVHGAAGGLHVWLDQLSGLSGTLDLLAVDLPGHGGSPPRTPPLDIPGHAAVLSRLLNNLGRRRALVVGHSMGGAIALSLALAHPDQVTGLALIATGARLPVSDLVLEAAGRDDFGALLTSTAYGPDTSPDVLARFANGPLPASPDVIRADFLACRAYDVRDRLSEIDAPAVVLGGTADALVGLGRIRQLADGLPDARLLLVEDAGHMVMQERPQEVNRALAELSRRISHRPTTAPPPPPSEPGA